MQVKITRTQEKYLHLEKFKLHDYAVDYRGSTADRGYFGNFSLKADRPLRRRPIRASLSLHSRSGKIFRGRACSRLPV